ncbi:MAG: PIN domain-containing protein [Planctomycetota bacterium]
MERSSDRVVVDTHLWIEFFSGKHNPCTLEVERLIRSKAVHLVWPVLYEVLIGLRHEGQRQYLSSRLRAFPLLQTSEAVWLHAIELGRLQGVIVHQVPASDVLIAAHCEVHRCALFSRDPHFDVFPGLERHAP